MPANRTTLVHVAPRVQGHGGIESLLERLREAGGSQHFIALFDRRPELRDDYANLDFDWRMPIWRMRARFRRALAAHAGSIVVYHHGWGMQLFHDVDAAGRRILMCETSPAYHARDFSALAEVADAAGGISPALVECIRAAAPEWSPERSRLLLVPIAVPAGLERPRGTNGELVLGFAGRLERAHKRMERLPEFLRALRATGRRFRFEVTGGGSLRAALEAETREDMKFHGWLSREEYWRVLAGWDAIVFFSDAEGGPIGLVEAAALGAIPFFPRIGGSLGDAYAPMVDARCHYPGGDMGALAHAVDAVFSEAPEWIAGARRRAQAAVAAHCTARFGQEMLDFADTIARLPSVARRRRRRARLADALPLGLVTRVLPGALWRW